MKFVKRCRQELYWRKPHTVGTRETCGEADNWDTDETHWEDAHGCTGKTLWKGVCYWAPSCNGMGAPYPLARMLPAGKEAIHWQLSCWSKRYSSKQRREPSSPCSVSSPLHPSIFWQSIVPSGKGETCHRAKKGGFGPKEQQIANWHNGCICIYVSKWLKNHLCSTYIRALKYQSKSYLRGTENLFLMISLRHWLFISIAPFVHSGAQFQISPQRLDSYILLAWDSGVGTELTSVLIIIHFWPRLCLISCTYEPESAVYFPWIPHSI